MLIVYNYFFVFRYHIQWNRAVLSSFAPRFFLVNRRKTDGKAPMQKQLDFEKIDNSGDYIAAYDTDLKIVMWNNALARKYNIPAEKAIGTNLLDLFPHIKGDFRIKCLREALNEKKNFYFPNLPYHYENAIYTQVIVPVDDVTVGWCVLSIVRDHPEGEIHKREDILSGVGIK